jgi:hypothetical protein
MVAMVAANVAYVTTPSPMIMNARSVMHWITVHDHGRVRVVVHRLLDGTPGRRGLGQARAMARFDLPPGSDFADVLTRQRGLVTAGQLTDAGVTLALAHERVCAGRWQRPHHSVYAVFSGDLDREATIWAGVLRCGKGAAASHQTAAELDGLCDQVDDLVHVTIGADRRVRGEFDGLRVHYAHRLPRTRHPTKLPPRTRVDDTVLDLLDVARTAREGTDWIIRAIRQRKTEPSRLAAALARRKKIRWRAMAEAMLLDVADGAHSMLEVEHLRRVERAHGLPRGERQRRAAGARVIWIDVDYDEFATRVELDGRIGHEGEGAFRDRQRDNRGAVGHRWTLRYGHAEVFGSPCQVAAEQAVVLQDRGWDGTPKPCGPECTVRATMARIRTEHSAAWAPAPPMIMNGK